MQNSDRNAERLVDALEDQGLLDKTVLVVFGDHGEELGEHGGIGHANSLYDIVTRVPLLVRYPGDDPMHCETAMSCFDIIPTVFEAANVARPPGFVGRSFLDECPTEASIQWSTVDYLEVSLRSVVEDNIKAIFDMHTGDVTYYDLEADPDEMRPIVVDSATQVRLNQLMDAWLAQITRKDG